MITMKTRQSFYFSVLLLVVTLCGAGKTSFGQDIQLNDPRYVFPNFSRTTGIWPENSGCRHSSLSNSVDQPFIIAIQTFKITTERIIGVGCSIEIDTSTSQKDWFPLKVYLFKLEQDGQTLSILDSALIDFFA